MKKIFKALTIAVIALTAAFACIFVAGCTDKGGETKLDYNFTIVYADGTPVNGNTGSASGGKLTTQLCTDRCIDLSVPLINIFPDENGKLYLTQEKINELFGSSTDITVFTFHVIDAKDSAHDCEFEINGKGDYKIKLYA